MSMMLWHSGLVIFSALWLSTVTAEEGELEVKIQAIANIQGAKGLIFGNLTFTETHRGATLISGKILGLPPGRHGIHIHETGDITSGCTATGAHYNPFKKRHGGRLDPERHVGDLGNIASLSPDKAATLYLLDNLIILSGPYSVVGRSVVIHAYRDDKGRGPYPDSSKTGHSGAEIACGVIGIMTPLDKYPETCITTSAVRVLPLKILLLPLLVTTRLIY